MKWLTRCVLCFLMLIVMVLGLAQHSGAAMKSLAVPLVVQSQNQWCWAGTSNAVLRYLSKNISQCYIADFGWTRKDCCTTPAN